MPLLIDPSTPAIAINAVSTTATVTTVSFNPPAGSILVIRWTCNTTNTDNPGSPTITDNLGAHLTYNLQDWDSRNDSPQRAGQCAIWTAVATAGGAMTITVTTGNTTNPKESMLHVTVLTGQHATTPVGAHGKNRSASAGSIAQTYTSQGDGGWGFLVCIDWDDLGGQTVGSGCTYTDGGTGEVGTGQFTYGLLRRTTADGVNGVSNSLNTTLGGTSTDLHWCWVEILPAPAAAGGSPVTAIPWSILHQWIQAVALRYLPSPASTSSADIGMGLLALSAQGTASKVVAQTGVAGIGLSARGVAAKVAPQASRAVMGISAYGPTQGVRAQTGRMTIGLSATAIAVHVGLPAGRSVVGLTGAGTAAKKIATTGLDCVGLSGTSTEVKRATPPGIVVAGFSGRGTEVKRATPTATEALGLSAQGTARKVVAKTGFVYLGIAPYGPTQGQRAQSGRCAIGVVGTATVVHIATPTGRCVSGWSGRGTTIKVAAQPGTAGIGLSARAIALRRALLTGSVVAGVSASGVAKHIAARNGVVVLGFTGRNTIGKNIPVLARSVFAIVGSGTPFKPSLVERDGELTTLTIVTRATSLTPPAAISLIRRTIPTTLRPAEGTD